jgi:hypothetical protein
VVKAVVVKAVVVKAVVVKAVVVKAVAVEPVGAGDPVADRLNRDDGESVMTIPPSGRARCVHPPRVTHGLRSLVAGWFTNMRDAVITASRVLPSLVVSRALAPASGTGRPASRPGGRSLQRFIPPPCWSGDGLCRPRRDRPSAARRRFAEGSRLRRGTGRAQRMAGRGLTMPVAIQ